jgi:hypothetical protein
MHALVFMVPNNVREEMADFPREVNRKIAKLKSIKERLPLWADEIPMTGVHADIDEDGPIFVVHGSNLTRAEQVARFVDRSTGREAVILHEQANQGRTLLEKFEHHAHATSFAVVLLTADDEGRRVGEDELRPRGRQNVVLELGFFLSRLGRDHVVVLLDPGVETPSDIAGLVYVTLPPWQPPPSTPGFIRWNATSHYSPACRVTGSWHARRSSNSTASAPPAPVGSPARHRARRRPRVPQRTVNAESTGHAQGRQSVRQRLGCNLNPLLVLLRPPSAEMCTRSQVPRGLTTTAVMG